MNEEVKDTKDILNTADVEARIYHAMNNGLFNRLDKVLESI